MRNHLFSLALLLGLAACLHHGPTVVETVGPRPGDVRTIDGVMHAFYEVVNIGPDEPRQWSRDRTLYSPWLRFVALGKSPSGRAETQIWTHQELVDATEPLIRQGFHEREIHRTERRYDRLAHIDSTYEVVFGPERKRSRGVNSLELYFDGERWWIASAMWQSEDPDHPLPKELLPSSSVAQPEASSSAGAQ
jgi:hypothetical protein